MVRLLDWLLLGASFSCFVCLPVAYVLYQHSVRQGAEMKIRVCEYNENVVGLRVAHIDFYMDRTGYVACPFTKGEVAFANLIASDCEKANRADMTRDALESYAQFYAKLLGVMGMDGYLPGQSTDDKILMKIIAMHAARK
jgi:hypothetical protein